MLAQFSILLIALFDPVWGCRINVLGKTRVLYFQMVNMKWYLQNVWKYSCGANLKKTLQSSPCSYKHMPGLFLCLFVCFLLPYLFLEGLNYKNSSMSECF